MTGLVDDSLDRQCPVLREVKQAQHDVLHQRQSCRHLEIALAFLADRMRGMIRRDNVNTIFIDGLTQGCAILGGFDRGIALYPGAQVFVAGFVKPQVMNAYLGCDALVITMCFGEQTHFDCSRQMQDMQQGIVSACEVHRLAGGQQARIRRTNFGVFRHWHGTAKLIFGARFVVADRRGVLAMCKHDDRRMLEQ